MKSILYAGNYEGTNGCMVNECGELVLVRMKGKGRWYQVQRQQTDVEKHNRVHIYTNHSTEARL